MVELPFVRKPGGVVCGNPLAEHVLDRRANLRGQVQLRVHRAHGVVPTAQLLGNRAEVDHAGEGHDQPVLPGAEDDLGELLQLLRGRARVAVVLDPLVGGDEDDDRREVPRPGAFRKHAGDLELRLSRLEAAAGLVHGRLRRLAQRAVALHLDLLQRVVQRREELRPRGGAPVATVGERLLRVGDGLECLHRARIVMPLPEQWFGPEAVDDLVLQAAHLDAVGEEVKALRGDDELAKAEVAVDRDVGLAAAGEPGEIGLQAQQRGLGLVLFQQCADLGEFEFEFVVHWVGISSCMAAHAPTRRQHGKGIATAFRLPIQSAHPKRRRAQLNFFAIV